MPVGTSERTCSHGGCDREYHAKGFCKTHYQKSWRARPPSESETPKPTECTYEADCHREIYLKRMCRRHYQRNWLEQKRAQAAGEESGTVDAATVRAHLHELAANGMGADTVAAITGLPIAVVADIAGRARRAERDIALTIMRVHAFPEDAEERAAISPHGARRRIHALVALGWTFEQVAGWLEMGAGDLTALIGPQVATIRAGVHHKIAAMFDARSMTVPQVKDPRSLALAAAEGWVTPLAWDDIDRDGQPAPAPKAPPATVDEIAVELALAGQKVRLSVKDRAEVVRQAHARRWSDARIARTTGMDEKSAIRIRGRLGLPAWTLAEQNA